MRIGIIYKRKILLAIFWAMLASCLYGQPNLSFYPMHDQFNSSEYNPAFLYSPEKFTFSIFPLAGFNSSINNQDLIRETLPKLLSGDIDKDSYDQQFDKLIERSTLYENVDVNLLSFTYRSEKGFFNFRIKERQFFGASVSGDLTDFIFKKEILSVPLNKIYHYPSQAVHYREYSLGYAYTSSDKRLSAGVRAKMYFGKFAFYSSVAGLISNRGTQHGLATTGILNISYPADLIVNPDDNTYEFDLSNASISQYVWNTGNPGMGMDLGIRYEINPLVNVSLSVIDIGAINWKKDSRSWDMTNAYPFFSTTYGLDSVNGVPTITKRENYKYADTFNFFGTEQDSLSFSKALPAIIYAGIEYEVNPGFTLSATNRYVLMKDLNYNSLALGATIEINKRLTFNTGYSIIGDSYFNIPLALLYKHNYGQIYAGTDNINILFAPSTTDWATISFGACFYLFTQRNLLLKRSEHLPFYQPKKSLRNRNTGLRVKSKREN